MLRFCSCFFLLFIGFESSFATGRSFLVENILSNYSIDTRPVSNIEDVLIINVTTGLNQIVYLDQKTNLLKISAYITMAWHDAFLRWDPARFRNQKVVFLPYSKIWMPEIFLYYSVDGKLSQSHMHGSSMEAQVTYTGEIRAYIPFTSDSLCNVDVKYFPFDEQNCDLQFQFGAWAQNTDTLVFDTAGRTYVNTLQFYDNQEWVLQHASMSTELINRTEFGDTQQFSVIKIKMLIQRQSFYYVFNLILPSTLITVVSLVGFHFPAASWGYRKAKFRLGITTLLSMSVLILTVATDLPKFSYQKVEGNRGSFSSVPIIVIYYVKLLSLISFGTCTSSIPVFIERTIIIHKSRFPDFLHWTVWPFQPKCPLVARMPKPENNINYNGGVSETLLDTAAGDPSDEEGNPGNRFSVSLNALDEIHRSNVRPILQAISDVRATLKDIRCIAALHAPDEDQKKDDILWQVFLFRFEMFSLFVYLILAFTAILMFFFREWY